MKLPLSSRLLACADFVRPGDRVADVGCDHGYLSIHLLKTGIAKTIIASDINEGPLQSALRNAHKYGVADKMRFYLSDGLRNVPQDFDCMVCAGMGAKTMVSILEAAPWLENEQYRLVLQCQNKTHLLRRHLSQRGWRITRETVLRDGRFLYTVMEAVFEPAAPLTPGQYYIPPALLEETGPETAEYYRRTVKKLRLSVDGKGEQAIAEETAALSELESLTENPKFSWLKEE